MKALVHADEVLDVLLAIEERRARGPVSQIIESMRRTKG